MEAWDRTTPETGFGFRALTATFPVKPLSDRNGRKCCFLRDFLAFASGALSAVVVVRVQVGPLLTVFSVSRGLYKPCARAAGIKRLL